MIKKIAITVSLLAAIGFGSNVFAAATTYAVVTCTPAYQSGEGSGPIYRADVNGVISSAFTSCSGALNSVSKHGYKWNVKVSVPPSNGVVVYTLTTQ